MVKTFDIRKLEHSDLKDIFVLDYFAILLLLIVLIGICISVFSSMVAVKKYVKLDQDNLYL